MVTKKVTVKVMPAFGIYQKVLRVIRRNGTARPMKLFTRYISATSLLLAGSISLAWADDPGGAYKRLLQARSLKCLFTDVSSGDWLGGSLITQSGREKFGLHFDGIDSESKKARLIGNVGAGDVMVLVTPSNITFIEQTGIGNLNVTTIFPAYVKGSNEFIAVTSRHQTLPDHTMNGKSPLVSQYHGSCQVWE